MVRYRSMLATLGAAAMLAACRGGASPALPPVAGPQAAQAFLRAGAVAAGLTPLGPTHMSDGVPASGKVNAFAIDPANPKTIYMAGGRGTGLETYSSAGILRTTDGGASWQPIDAGLTDPSGAISSVVNALWLDPKNPSVLLAATEYDGIFRSANAGTSWTNVYRGTQATQIASFGGALYATAAAGILRSSDGGSSWTASLAATAGRQPTAFGVVEGSHGNALYAGMSDGSVFAFRAAGARGTWSQVGTIPFDRHTGTDGSVPAVHQIAVDPLVPTTLFASTNDGRWDQDLHASTDGGKTWYQVLKKVYFRYGLGTQAIAFSAVHPHRLYVGSDGGMYYIDGAAANVPAAQAAYLSVIDLRDIWTMPNGSDDRCWIASDQGLDDEPDCSAVHRQLDDKLVSASSATGLARRFALSPDGKTMLVSLQDFDSHYTLDGGKTWFINSGGLYEDGFNELQPGNPSTCYAYDEAYGLRVSTDGCVQFAQPAGNQGKIFPSRLMTTPIAFDPKHPTTMYLASGSVGGVGFAPSPKAVFESTDGGATLTQLGWPVTAPGAVVVDPRSGSHILVGDLSAAGSSIQVTSDGGKTWTKAAGVPATPFWYAISVSPVNGNVVLASSVDSSNNVFVLRSTNGGKAFTRIATVTNAPLLRGRVERERLVRGAAAIGGDEGSDTAQAFIYSPEREIRFDQDAVKGIAPVAITTLRGAFLSTDDGASWRRLDAGMVAHSFWGIRWHAGYLYLGSDGQGVVRSNARLGP